MDLELLPNFHDQTIDEGLVEALTTSSDVFENNCRFVKATPLSLSPTDAFSSFHDGK